MRSHHAHPTRRRNPMAPRPAPRSERVDLPYPFVDLAQRRTEFLFRHMTYGDMPMRMVLASAYVQGMSDAVDALDAKGGGKNHPHRHVAIGHVPKQKFRCGWFLPPPMCRA